MEIQLSCERHIQIASCPELGIEYRSSRHGIVDALARKLIEAGVDPDETVIVTRDGTPVFKDEWPLSKWAGVRLTENDDEGMRWRRFEKQPEFADGSNRTARFEPSGVSIYPTAKEAAE